MNRCSRCLSFLIGSTCNSQFPCALGPTEKHDGLLQVILHHFQPVFHRCLTIFSPLLAGSLSYFLQIFNTNGDPITDDPNHNFSKTINCFHLSFLCCAKYWLSIYALFCPSFTGSLIFALISHDHPILENQYTSFQCIFSETIFLIPCKLPWHPLFPLSSTLKLYFFLIFFSLHLFLLLGG